MLRNKLSRISAHHVLAEPHPTTHNVVQVLMGFFSKLRALLAGFFPFCDVREMRKQTKPSTFFGDSRQTHSLAFVVASFPTLRAKSFQGRNHAHRETKLRN